MYVLSKFHYIENYATGLQKIRNAYADYEQKPIIEATDNFFVVTLPNVNPKADDEANDPVNDPVSAPVNDPVSDPVNDPVNLSDEAANIFKLIKGNINITRGELVECTGKSLATVRRKIAELKDKGYIERVGSDKSGYWKILK